MSYFRMRQFGSFVMLFATIILLMSSCKKDDPEVPAYVGKWQAFTTFDEEGAIPGKETMTLTETSFSVTAQVSLASGQWTDYIKIGGSLSVSGNEMTLEIKELGVSTVDILTGLPTGQIVTYKEGTSQFETIMQKSGQERKITSEFAVSGDKLSVNEDLNNDGDVTDQGETTIYTKVQ